MRAGVKLVMQEIEMSAESLYISAYSFGWFYGRVFNV